MQQRAETVKPIRLDPQKDVHASPMAKSCTAVAQGLTTSGEKAKFFGGAPAKTENVDVHVGNF